MFSIKRASVNILMLSVSASAFGHDYVPLHFPSHVTTTGCNVLYNKYCNRKIYGYVNGQLLMKVDEGTIISCFTCFLTSFSQEEHTSGLGRALNSLTPMVEFVLGLNCQFQNNMKKYSAVADKVMHMTCLFTLCFPISFNLQKILWWFCCSVRAFPLLFWPFLLYSVP